MKLRIQQIINAKGFKTKKEFCDFMGWSTQYLTRLLGGGSVGLAPVTTLLERFPDIDARWLILGTGTMFGTHTTDLALQRTIANLRTMAELERYIPYMTPMEQIQYAKGDFSFSEKRLAELESRACAHDTFINSKFPDYCQKL